MALPALLEESKVRTFNYYQDNAIYEGMADGNKLYKLVQCFPIDKRVHALALGCELNRIGSIVITTNGTSTYKVWADIRLEVDPQPVLKMDWSNWTSTAEQVTTGFSPMIQPA